VSKARLQEIDHEIEVLEEFVAQCREEATPRRDIVEGVRQLALRRQERVRLIETARAHRKRNPVLRLRALAKVLYDAGNGTAAPKLEAQANKHEIELEQLRIEREREEGANLTPEEMLADLLEVIRDEVEVDTDAARRIYAALCERDDADEVVQGDNVVQFRG
jgi:phosphomannomutase